MTPEVGNFTPSTIPAAHLGQTKQAGQVIILADDLRTTTVTGVTKGLDADRLRCDRG